jgi:predicted glycosyltransferase
MRIWIDITNTPHVNVLMPIIQHMEGKGHKLIITARDFSETLHMLEQKGIEPLHIGHYKGKSRIRKLLGLFSRMYSLYSKVPGFDLAFSLGGNYTSAVAWLRKKKSIVFSDNDISFKFFSFALGTYFIFPSYFNYQKIKDRYKIKEDRIKIFNGFKEDIYIADYKMDDTFTNKLPFKEFITIRPENLKASYVSKNSMTIVPKLFETFRNENILFLPRYEEEKQYAEGFLNVWYPNQPLNGLDVCYHTKAMLTGAGTFAREAALLGIPAVSFFPGEIFLTVDKVMQKMGIEFKSRNPEEIKNYIANATRKPASVEKSREVLKEVLLIIDEICYKVEHNC